MKVGLFGMMFIVFLVLKLTEVIAWSWWWVTAPLWGGFALLAGGALLVFLVVIVIALLENK